MNAPSPMDNSPLARILRDAALRLELAGELYIERDSRGAHVSYRLTDLGKQRLLHSMMLTQPMP